MVDGASKEERRVILGKPYRCKVSVLGDPSSARSTPQRDSSSRASTPPRNAARSRGSRTSVTEPEGEEPMIQDDHPPSQQEEPEGVIEVAKERLTPQTPKEITEPEVDKDAIILEQVLKAASAANLGKQTV